MLVTVDAGRRAGLANGPTAKVVLSADGATLKNQGEHVEVERRGHQLGGERSNHRIATTKGAGSSWARWCLGRLVDR